MAGFSVSHMGDMRLSPPKFGGLFQILGRIQSFATVVSFLAGCWLAILNSKATSHSFYHGLLNMAIIPSAEAGKSPLLESLTSSISDH